VYFCLAFVFAFELVHTKQKNLAELGYTGEVLGEVIGEVIG